MHKHHKISSDKSVIIKIFNNGYLIALLLYLSGSIGSLCDGIVAARGLGTEELAAIGLIYPFTKFMECISTIFSSGSQTVIGRKVGQNKFKEVSDVFYTSLTILGIIGVLLAGIVAAFAGPLSISLGANAASQTLLPTSDYLITIASGAPAYLLTLYLIPLLQLDGEDKLINIATAIMTLTNISLNILFLILDFGIKGIGYSTSISYLVSMIILLSHIFSKRNGILLQGNFRINPNCLGEVCREGAPSAFKNITSIIYNMSVNNLLSYVGSAEALAAFSAYKSTKFIFLSVTEANINPVRLTQSMLYEEKDWKNMRVIFKYSIAKGLILSVLLSAAVWLFGRPMYSLMLSGTVLDMAVSIVNWSTVLFILDTFLAYYLAYFQAIGRKAMVCSISIVLNIVTIPFIWILYIFFGLEGVWMSLAVQLIITDGYILVCALIMGRRNQNLIDKLLVLPIEERDKYEMFDYHISSMEDVAKASSEFGEVCGKKIINKKKSFYCSLAFEEILFNILEYQKSINSQVTNIDAHIIISDKDKVMIRIKDDSKERNPFVKYEHSSSEDKFENLGIKILKSLAENIKYSYVFGINYFTIKV